MSSVASATQDLSLGRSPVRPSTHADRALKILHVFSALAPRYGWAFDMMSGLCGQQARRGHGVTVFSTNLDWERTLDVPLDQPVFTNGVEVRYFPVADVQNRLVRKFAYSRRLAHALSERIRDYDIVHLHGLMLFPVLAAGYNCRAAGVPYVLSPYGLLDPFTYRKSRVLKDIYLALFARRDLNNAATIHFMTKGELEGAASFGMRAPTAVIELGIHPENYRQTSTGDFGSRYPATVGKRLIVYLGRISYSKGLDLLARAFGRVARSHPDAHLVFVGPDHEGYGSVVRQILGEEGASDRATFTGMISDPEKIDALCAANVFVLPSYVEGFGLAMVEAMACGRPVVITSGSHMKDAVEDAEAGLVVDVSVDGLERALIRLLDDPQLCATMGRNGRSLVEAQFSWDRVAERTLSLYGDILGSRR
jgi:glycosyltransferase involved in cell wall biosynthesis